ncbi:MAG: hypothetical protein HY306_08045 [Nitrosomonadales bacterium]|nr:hypothetical protein [Nitrosomonadales bacterium]
MRTYIYCLPIFLCLMCAGCDHGNDTTSRSQPKIAGADAVLTSPASVRKQEMIAGSNMATNNKNIVLASSGVQPELRNKSDEWIAYKLEKAELTQTLKVRYKGENKIDFALNIDGACKRNISGEAASQSGDHEIDDDENSIAYFAEEFNYEKAGCYIGVRIADNNKKMARIKASCGKGCSFSNDLMMRQ